MIATVLTEASPSLATPAPDSAWEQLGLERLVTVAEREIETATDEQTRSIRLLVRLVAQAALAQLQRAGPGRVPKSGRIKTAPPLLISRREKGANHGSIARQ